MHTPVFFYKDETFPADTLRHSEKVPVFISEDKANIAAGSFWTQSENI